MVSLNSLDISFKSRYQAKQTGSITTAVNAVVQAAQEERFNEAPDEYTYDAMLTWYQAEQLQEAGYEVMFTEPVVVV